MAKTYHDQDADLSLIQAKKVAIIGYGSQGHAHALNLKDSGVHVKVGLRPGSPNAKKAELAGLEVGSVAEVSAWADVIMNLTPDQTAAKVYHAEIEPNMKPNVTLMFAHGFNIRFRTITPPPTADVSLVAPKGPGHRVREVFTEGGGIPGLVAVEQDASGRKDGAEADVEAVGEHQSLAGGQVRLDLSLVDLGCGLVGREVHDDVGPLADVGDGVDDETGFASALGVGGVGAEAYADVYAGVLEVEGVGVALRAVADDGYLLGLNEGEVCVCVVVGLCHFDFSLAIRCAVKSKEFSGYAGWVYWLL